MPEPVTLTMSEEEARLVLRSLRGVADRIRRDYLHEEDVRSLDVVTIQLEAQIKIAERRRR